MSAHSAFIFHVFTECRRLAEIFKVLTHVFNLFGVLFTAPVFICGVGFKKTEKAKCHILNFLIGEAKMSIYLTHRGKLQGGQTLDPVEVQREGQTEAGVLLPQDHREHRCV